MSRIRQFLINLRANFWVLPILIVMISIFLAVALTKIDIPDVDRGSMLWPLVSGAGPEGAREVMSAIAGSMMTVLGVTFSMILVVLSLASSQYTSRILRNFIRDRVTQLVLGVLSGIFTYCIIVLRTIRSTGNEFVPNLAVTVGFVLALGGVVTFMYFLHHIAEAIQAANIVASIAQETIGSIDRLFPEKIGEDPGKTGATQDNNNSRLWESRQGTGPDRLSGHSWQVFLARDSGYVQSVNSDGLVSLACRWNTIVRLERGIGDFVVQGTPLATLLLAETPDEKMIKSLLAEIPISRHRTVEQDPAFGIRQIVDVALKALSPAIADNTTATICVDYLTAIFARLATRDVPSPYRHADGQLRVIAMGSDFPDLLGKAFNEIRTFAEGNHAILSRMVGSLQTLTSLTAASDCRKAINEQGEWIGELAERTVGAAHERASIETQLAQLRAMLGSGIA